MPCVVQGRRMPSRHGSQYTAARPLCQRPQAGSARAAGAAQRPSQQTPTAAAQPSLRPGAPRPLQPALLHPHLARRILCPLRPRAPPRRPLRPAPAVRRRRNVPAGPVNACAYVKSARGAKARHMCGMRIVHGSGREGAKRPAGDTIALLSSFLPRALHCSQGAAPWQGWRRGAPAPAQS